MLEKIRRNEQVLSWLLFAGFILLALASNIYYFRLDMTENKSYKLSSASKNLYKEIPEKIRITYFLSKNLNERHPGPSSVLDFLKELEVAGKGKISLRIVDPTKDSTEADRFGLEPRQMQIVEHSEQRVALVYSGIAVEYLERFDSLPFVLSRENLEYELLKTIRFLVSNKKPVTGILIGDNDKSLKNDYQSFVDVLNRYSYETRELRLGSAIDDDVDLLFVLGNNNIDRYDSFFIDDFIMRKGKVFFAVKGVNVDPERGLAASPVPEAGLLSVLSFYGFNVERKLVLDQSNLTVPFQSARPQGSYQIQYIRYPHWIVLDKKNAATDHPVSANFSGLDLFWASPMTLRPQEGFNITELVKTSPKAWLQTEQFFTGPDEQALYGKEKDETTGQYLVAAAASGKIKSAFFDGTMPGRAGAEELEKPARLENNNVKLIVVSCADFVTDLLRMTDSAFNLSFVLSAADWLSSADDLLSLGARMSKDYRLDKIKDESFKKLLVSFTYFVNLVLLPLLVTIYAINRAIKRERKEKHSRIKEGPVK